MAKRFEAASLWLAWLTGLPRRSAWRRLAFQRALREAALDFASLTAPRFDTSMGETLRRLGEAGGFSHAVLCLEAFTPERVFRWSAIRAPSYAGDCFAGNSFIWLGQKLKSGDGVALLEMGLLPAEAAAERESLSTRGAGSAVVIRLAFGDKVLGKLALFSSQSRMLFPAFDLRLFRMCGTLLSNVVARVVEEAFRDNEQKYQELFELGAEAVFLVENQTGRILEANKAATDIYGYSRDELLALRNVDLSAEPEDTTKVTTATPSGSIIIPLRFHRRRDGTLFRVEINGRFFSLKGNPVHVAAIRDITGRKQLEAELRESEAKYAALVNNIQDAIAVIQDGIIQFVNPAMSRLLGYPVGEIIGQSSTFGLSPESRKKVSGMSRPAGGYAELKVCNRAGEQRDVEMFTSTISYRGHPALMVVSRDITERRVVEKGLRASEERYRMLVEMAGDAIYTSDSEGIILSWNLAASRIFGYQAEEIIGRSVVDILADEDKDRSYRARKTAVATGELKYGGRPFEFEARRKDGARFPAEITVSMSGSGENLLITTIIRDVTARKAAEAALIQNEERFRTLTTMAPVGIYLTGPDGRCTYANARWLEMAGLTMDEAKGDGWLKGIHPDDRGLIREKWNEMVWSQGRWSLEYRFQGHDGTVTWVLGQAAELRDHWGNLVGYVGTNMDISERKRHEEERQSLAQMEALGLLAGGIAHDFNNILTSIMGNVNLALMDAPDGSELAMLMAEADRACQRATGLTQQLLTFSRGGAPVRRSASIGELLHESVEFALRGSNTRAVFSLDAELWPVAVDRGQVSRVFSNLAINAREAMPDGGLVNVTARNVELDENEVFPLPAGGYVLLELADNGPGINPVHMSKLFQPYFTTKSRGSGLGLSTSYSIVRRHGGMLTAESTPGKGATFRVFLPVSPEAPSAEGEGEKLDKAGPVCGRVLLMDDEEQVLNIGTRILERIGCQVTAVREGKEALEYFIRAREQGEPFNVVVLDLTVPGGMGGRETLRKMLEIDPGVKAIVCSGYTADDVLADPVRYGFRSAVLKPYPAERFQQAVREAFNA
jgi:PAS domain S-box-containing protein